MKRIFDFIFSIIAIIIFFPILLIISIVVFTTMGTPIIFKQERSGKFGKPFNIYKFRSMSEKKDSNGNLLPNEMRTTEVGKILRKTSLDELPQLFNVLKGELSLVGPRPLHMEYNKYYNKEQAERLLVTPGITGWAQINGRNNLSWEKKFELDTWYVRNQKFSLDILILIKTVIKVLKRKDINSKTNKQVEKFNGSN